MFIYNEMNLLDLFLKKFEECLNNEVPRYIFNDIEGYVLHNRVLNNMGDILFNNLLGDKISLSKLYSIEPLSVKNHYIRYVYAIIDHKAWFHIKIYTNIETQQLDCHYLCKCRYPGSGESEHKIITFKEFLLKLYENDKKTMNMNIEHWLFGIL